MAVHALAARKAIHSVKNEDEFYFLGMYDLLLRILEHSHPTAFESDGKVTPYAYLIKEIFNDFGDLTRAALQKAVDESLNTGSEATPSSVDKALVHAWTCCIARIADEKYKIDRKLRTDVIEEYFSLIFECDFTSNNSDSRFGPNKRFPEWRDLLWDKFQKQIPLLRNARTWRDSLICNAIESMRWSTEQLLNSHTWLSSVDFPEQWLPPNFRYPIQRERTE